MRRRYGLAHSPTPFSTSGNSRWFSAFYVLPQTENVNLVHLGLGTEELASGIFVNDSVTLRLAAVSGPGHFSIWKDGLDPLVPDLK